MEGYSHLILSGSTCSILEEHPTVPPTMALVRDAVARRVPVLGICYGHQLVIKALLGDTHLRTSQPAEMGWLPVRVLHNPNGLFEGLPNPFDVFVGHFDEVHDLPSGWTILAESEHCAVHAYLNESLRVMGFQFHPEMDPATGNGCLLAYREPLEAKGFNVDRIVAETRDDGSGALLFPRFLDYPWPS
jgi:GMP synthase (glutamine-hydrolysing)